MALAPIYKIHPAIGIARVGNGDRDKFFIGPEVPGQGPVGDSSFGTVVPPFKDAGKIKPQAARFRIWEYVDQGGKYGPSREINLGEKDCVSVVWKVHLANRKASFFKFKNLQGEETAHPPGDRRNDSVIDRRRLEIDPLERFISGANARSVEFRKGTSKNTSKELWPNPAPSPPIEYLGELRTDSLGRLVVIGGLGRASAIPGKALGSDVFNNDGWFDDVSDGPVSVALTLKDSGGKKKTVPVEGAWVLCGPPDFAPYLANVVTLYDVLYDMAARELRLPTNETIYDSTLKPLFAINAEFKSAGSSTLSKYTPSFDEEIFPIIRRAQEYVFVFEALKTAHVLLPMYSQLGEPSGSKALRQAIFDRLHPPGLAGRPAGKDMPKLNGDEYSNASHKRNALTLTETQYALMSQWTKGNFVKTGGVLPPPLKSSAITPDGLDRAALENCVGGAFCPGIEVGWQIRNKKLFSAPFRINQSGTSQYLGDSGAIQPGHFSRQMALPWHTDFLACRLQNNFGWWPAQRPDVTYLSKADFDANPKKSQAWHRATTGGATSNWPSGGTTPSGTEFIDNHHKLGFVREDPKFYHVEKERDTNVP